jgi:hypothetical protein
LGGFFYSRLKLPKISEMEIRTKCVQILGSVATFPARRSPTLRAASCLHLQKKERRSIRDILEGSMRVSELLLSRQEILVADKEVWCDMNVKKKKFLINFL